MDPNDKQTNPDPNIELKIPIQQNIRSMRLYRTNQGNGMRTTQVRDIGILPIVKTNAEVVNFIKSIFGTSTYSASVKRYYLPKRFLFANPYISGKRIYETIPFTEITKYVKSNLTKLGSTPTYTIGTNNGDCVFDLSNVFDAVIRDDVAFKHSPRYVNNADLHYPKIIDYFTAPRYGVDHDYLKNLQISNFHPILASGFHHVIFGIPIKTATVSKVYTYMQNGTATTLSVKRDPDYDLIALLRFLVLVFDPFKISDKTEASVKDLAEAWRQEELSFVFYNEKNFFYLNFRDLARWGIKTANDFRKKLLARILILIRQNANVIQDAIEESDDDENKIDSHSELTEQEVHADQIKNATPVFSSAVQEKVNDEAVELTDLKDEKNKEIRVDLEKASAGEPQTNDQLKKQVDKLVVDHNSKQIIRKKKDDDEPSIDKAKFTILDKESEEKNEDTDDNFDEDENENQENPESAAQKESKEKSVLAARIANLGKVVKPTITKAQAARIELIKEKYKSISFDDKRTLQDILEDTKATIIEPRIPDVKVRDESMKHSSLDDMEKSYINKTFHKDIISAVHAFSQNKSLNMHIVGFNKHNTSDQFNEKETWVFDIQDENMKHHKLKFNVPIVDQDGFMKINGDIKVLKKQWLMIPLVKIKPDLVLISSNFNKAFVYRQGTTLNHNLVIVNKIFRNYISRIDGCKIDFGNNTKENHDFITSVEYDELARKFHRVTISTANMNLVIYFNQNEIRKDIVNLQKIGGIQYEFKVNKLPFAILKAKDNKPVVIDTDIEAKNDSVCASIINLIGNSGVISDFTSTVSKIPSPKRRMYTRMMLQSKQMPLIAFLSYLYGFKAVIDKVNVKEIHFAEKRERGNLDPFVKFKNGYLYYPQYPLSVSLFFNGLTVMDTEEYNIEDFETITPYMDYIYNRYQTRNPLKGWTTFHELFLDPITVEVLRDYNLPTDFLELFLYANDLLGDNQHSHETDASLYRLRTHETLVRELYSSLAEQYISLKQKGFKRESFTIFEDEITKRLHKSTILENYDMLNPVNELKSKGMATFKGPGGVNIEEAFPIDKRGLGENMVGIVGFSVPENSNVGITKQLVMNPRIKSTRGYLDPIKSREDIDHLTFSHLATPEEAAIAFVNLHDDTKRVGFTSAQTKHVVSVAGSDTPLIGTGYEKTIVHKIGDIYAFKAKDDGKVVAVEPDRGLCILEYKSGEKDTVEFGALMNRNSNMFLSNPMELNVVVGQKFKKGEVISYNKEFFAKRGSHLILKQGAMCHAVVLEGETTEEDSSEITETFAAKMSTDVIKRKQISIGAKTNIISYKKIGDEVLYGDPLMIFEDAMDAQGQTTAILNSLGDVDEKTLSELVHHIPKASDTGKIKDIKVYWTVPLDQMSDSCREFVELYIKSEKKKISYEESFTSKPSLRRRNIEISKPYMERVRGAQVDRDQGSVVVEYFIGGYHDMGPGDKLTYYSALKSVIADVIPKEMEPKTTFGDGRVDAIIGTKNIAARMIQSIYFAGLLGKVIYNRARQISEQFFEEE